MRKLRFAILLGGLVLAAAVVLQFVPPPGVQPGKGRHLADILPTRLGGWDSRVVSLGPSEAVSGAVEDVLKFDDVFYREYTRGGEGVSLYVAYWNPGKMPVQLVASHTPDRCWVEAGWQCDQARHDVRLRVAGRELSAGQGRVFHDRHGRVQHVIYWHLVGNNLFDYGTRVSTIPNPWKWVREMAKQPFAAPREQYFIRLSSDRPFAAVENDSGFGQLVETLARLGLAQR